MLRLIFLEIVEEAPGAVFIDNVKACAAATKTTTSKMEANIMTRNKEKIE